MPRPRDGKEVKKVYSVKVEPRVFVKIVKQYGSFSAFVKEAIKKLVN